MTPKGTLVHGAVDGRMDVVAVEKTFPADAQCQEIVCSSDGRWLALALGRTIQLWDGQTLKLHRKLEGHEDYVRCLAFSRDGTLLASGGSDRTVRIWATTAGGPKATMLGHSESITSLAFSKKGRTVASSSRDGTIQLWDTTTGESKTTLTGHIGPVHWIEFSPEGDELASAGEDGTIRLWKAPVAAGPKPESKLSNNRMDP